MLAHIDKKSSQKVIEALADVAPDFATYLFEFPYGDIYSRPALDLRGREMVSIAVLAATGSATTLLKGHIEAGLNVGLSQEEIVEILMQLAVLAGFPAAINALFAAKDVFTQRSTSPQHVRS
nr:carboxymuconolactone decarboxylase family protein [Paraburkholderia sp.]